MESVYSSPFFIFYVIWSSAWQGIALWRAAKLSQRNWFVVMLIINPAGLLHIVYLFWFAKKRLTLHEMKQWKNVFVKQVPKKD